MNRLPRAILAISLLGSLAACAGVPVNDGVGILPDEKAISPIARAREGDRAAARGEFDLALAQYAMALEEGGENADLYYKIGLVHQSRGRSDLAEGVFQRALAGAPLHVPARVALGLMALREGNLRYAEAMLGEALERDPRNWKALNALGVLSDLEEDFAAAAGFYDRALALVPNSTDVLNNMGYSLYLQGRMEEAKRRFEAVVDADPDDSHGWSNLALVHLQQGNETMARMAFRNVVEEHQALNNIGYFKLLREDARSAREKFRDAARAAPSYYALAYRNLAAIDAGEFGRAEPEEGEGSPDSARAVDGARQRGDRDVRESIPEPVDARASEPTVAAGERPAVQR